MAFWILWYYICKNIRFRYLNKFLIMHLILLQIKDAIKSVIRTLFVPDMDVMSDEVRQILANPEDAKKYKEAINDLAKGEKKEVTIELSNKTQLTLIQ